MDWSASRASFPILARKTYLNTCSLGALSVEARAAVNLFLDQWDDLGASAWYQLWLGEAQRVRERFARLVNASPEEIALLPNVSAALSALASVPGRDGNVVCAAMDFPTIPYQWQARGAEVRLASGDGVSTAAEAYEKLIDARTSWLATSHVFYTTGAMVEAKRLCDAARRVGALSVIDGYQAAGQLPVDVKAMGCDAYLSGGLKWLLGGPGICYLYVRKELHAQLGPVATGWFAHADQFAFDTSSFRPRADARRFEAGTHAVPAVFAGGAGLDWILELGPERIRQRTSELVGDLVERLRDAGHRLLTPETDERRAGIVAVAIDDAPAVVAKLAERQIIVDARPGRIRVSPYFYNTEREIERFVEALREIASVR